AQRAEEVKAASATLTRARAELQSTIDAFLADVSRDFEDRRAEPRRPMREIVTVVANGKSRQTRTLDLTRLGARLEGLHEFESGTPVTIDFAEGLSVSAHVVRRSEDGVAVKFDRALDALPGAALAA
ncbi:MAG: PilZ domain-containing protein, partial [Oceanicaulis sp.]